MKTILTLLLATLCAATSYGQTIKSLGFNSTNGQVIANTGTNVLTMPTEVNFGEDIQIRNNKISGFSQSINFEEQQFQDGTDDLIIWSGLHITLGRAIGFVDASDAAQTRTNLGLPLEALTNTSNVTAMRALSGSTDTNHPFSGSVSVVGTNNTNTLVFSNGILQEVQ
jgi:hypothetical protein